MYHANVNVDLMEENVIQINGGITINVDMNVSKERHVCEKDYIWNHSACSCENGKNLESIMDDSAIMYDEVIESYDKETKTIPSNFNEKTATCKTKNFFIILEFL